MDDPRAHLRRKGAWAHVTELQGAPAIAARLAAAGPSASYFTSAAWFANVMATAIDPGDRPVLFESPGEAGPVLLAMLWRKVRLGPVPARQIASLSNVYSCAYAPVGTLDPGAGVLHRWAEALARRPDAPDCVRFDAIDRRSPALDGLSAGLQAAGFLVEPVMQFGNWFLVRQEGDDFAAYWEDRPSQLRNTVERKLRTLNRQHDFQVELLASPEHAERATTAYLAVDGQSWKGAEPYPDFMPGLIRGGMADGTVRVGVLTVDGEAAAAQVWCEHAGAATIFKLSYAERFKKLSVGSILTYCMTRDAFDRETTREIDFGRGDDPYKRDWLPSRRERWGLFAYNRSTAPGLLLAGRNLLPKLARRALGRID